MGRLLHRVGRVAATHPWIVLAAWAAGCVSAVLLVGFYGANTSDDLRLPGSDSQAATDLLAARFPPQENGANPVVFHATTGKVADAPKQEAIESARAALVQLPHVYSAPDPFGSKGQAQLSKDGKTAFIPVLLDVG